MGNCTSIPSSKFLDRLQSWKWRRMEVILKSYRDDDYDFGIDSGQIKDLIGCDDDDAEGFIALLSRNNNRKVNVITLLLFLIVIIDQKNSDIKKERIITAFNLLDFNGNNNISIDEMMILLLCISATYTSLFGYNHIDDSSKLNTINIFKRYHKSADSNITKKEFLKLSSEILDVIPVTQLSNIYNIMTLRNDSKLNQIEIPETTLNHSYYESSDGSLTSSVDDSDYGSVTLRSISATYSSILVGDLGKYFQLQMYNNIWQQQSPIIYNNSNNDSNHNHIEQNITFTPNVNDHSWTINFSRNDIAHNYLIIKLKGDDNIHSEIILGIGKIEASELLKNDDSEDNTEKIYDVDLYLTSESALIVGKVNLIFTQSSSSYHAENTDENMYQSKEFPYGYETTTSNIYNDTERDLTKFDIHENNDSVVIRHEVTIIINQLLNQLDPTNSQTSDSPIISDGNPLLNDDVEEETGGSVEDNKYLDESEFEDLSVRDVDETKGHNKDNNKDDGINNRIKISNNNSFKNKSNKSNNKLSDIQNDSSNNLLKKSSSKEMNNILTSSPPITTTTTTTTITTPTTTNRNLSIKQHSVKEDVKDEFDYGEEEEEDDNIDHSNISLVTHTQQPPSLSLPLSPLDSDKVTTPHAKSNQTTTDGNITTTSTTTSAAGTMDMINHSSSKTNLEIFPLNENALPKLPATTAFPSITAAAAATVTINRIVIYRDSNIKSNGKVKSIEVKYGNVWSHHATADSSQRKSYKEIDGEASVSWDIAEKEKEKWAFKIASDTINSNTIQLLVEVVTGSEEVSSTAPQHHHHHHHQAFGQSSIRNLLKFSKSSSDEETIDVDLFYHGNNSSGIKFGTAQFFVYVDTSADVDSIEGYDMDFDNDSI